MHNSGSTGERNWALDFTKGALVLFMVLYHSINYFLGPEGDNWLRYLRFVPPSFIMIAGFLLSNVYRSKYDVRDKRLHQRLAIRGAKLLAIFTVLNLLANLALRRNYNGAELGITAFVKSMPSIYLTGNASSTVFDVLLPISYLLFVSGLLLIASRSSKWVLPVIFGVVFAAQILLEQQGVVSQNLTLLVFGLLGMALGLVSGDTINWIASRTVIVAVAYAGYLIAVTVWRESSLLQCIGASLSLLLIYAVGLRWGGHGSAQRLCVLLGKYSLAGYIGQIALLRIIRSLLRLAGIGSGQFVIGLGAAMILTVLTIVIVDRARLQWKPMDRAYRAVFA